MKRLFIAGLVLIAAPALAQTTSPDPAPPPMTPTAPAPGGQVPDTTLSTAPTPSNGPRAQEADLPSNSATSANESDMAVAPATTAPEAPLAQYPICKAGEFDNCMEPGNGGATNRPRLKRPR